MAEAVAAKAMPVDTVDWEAVVLTVASEVAVSGVAARRCTPSRHTRYRFVSPSRLPAALAMVAEVAKPSAAVPGSAAGSGGASGVKGNGGGVGGGGGEANSEADADAVVAVAEAKANSEAVVADSAAVAGAGAGAGANGEGELGGGGGGGGDGKPVAGAGRRGAAVAVDCTTHCVASHASFVT
ncbi:hypothetical protein CYMTET_6569 [Cymbomonas tetramitiformis]|uniref:Uncharacterized protein n=1 Tax=Cymbomonas tetramitiformis TaxID=36881 RepID=A0AAE0LHR7_9CHLO|nr:hypothetical protein CYMTET_6569 [Cymbomonas tetramitiformis]